MTDGTESLVGGAGVCDMCFDAWHDFGAETTVLKRAPTAAAPAAPGVGPAAEGVAWVKLCLKNDETANKQLCVVNHEVLDPNTGMVLVAAEVRSIEGEDKQYLLVRLPPPIRW